MSLDHQAQRDTIALMNQNAPTAARIAEVLQAAMPPGVSALDGMLGTLALLANDIARASAGEAEAKDWIERLAFLLALQARAIVRIRDGEAANAVRLH